MSISPTTIDVAPGTSALTGHDPGDAARPQVRVVDYCQGHTWVVSRAAGVMWVLSGPPAVVARRVAAARAAYRRCAPATARDGGGALPTPA